MIKKIPMKGGLEQDAFTGWKHVLCYMQNIPGISKYAKRSYNKRFRKTIKEQLRKQDYENI